MNELQITSIHEAGHAVTALRLGLVFDHVTAVPDDYAETDGALHWTELHTADGLEISPELDAVVLLAAQRRPSPRERLSGKRDLE
jgi:hypothetical protein